MPVNQQANGGAFNLLGTFNLNGSSTVTLSDNANGYVVADAIQLIALTTVPKMYFVHTDHLNTPRLIASDTGQAVWQWNNDDPYGNNAPNENPAGAGQFTCNLRLPGQYFDSETNTHYNYFRDYDPLTGRYIQSDLIGLFGGINTYAYANNNSLSITDESGLYGHIVIGAIVGAVSAGVAANTVGASNRQIATAIVWGGVVGAGATAVAPLIPIAGVVISRAGAGAIGNLLGQVQNIEDPCFKINPASTVASALAGGFTGLWGSLATTGVISSGLLGRLSLAVPSTGLQIGAGFATQQPSNECQCPK